MVRIIADYVNSNEVESFTLREVMKKTDNIGIWDNLEHNRQEYGRRFKEDKEMHQKLNIKHIESYADVVEYFL